MAAPESREKPKSLISTESESSSYYTDEHELSESSKHADGKKKESVSETDPPQVQAAVKEGDDREPIEQEKEQEMDGNRKAKGKEQEQERNSEGRRDQSVKPPASDQHAAALERSEGVRCKICDKWLRNGDSALRAHLETSIRCQTRQGNAGLRKQCQRCHRWIADNEWSWQQHSWYCQAQSYQPYQPTTRSKSPKEGVQRIELHSRPRGRSRSPLKLPRHSGRDRYGDGRDRHDKSGSQGHRRHDTKRAHAKPRNRAGRSRSPHDRPRGHVAGPSRPPPPPPTPAATDPARHRRRREEEKQQPGRKGQRAERHDGRGERLEAPMETVGVGRVPSPSPHRVQRLDHQGQGLPATRRIVDKKGNDHSVGKSGYHEGGLGVHSDQRIQSGPPEYSGRPSLSPASPRLPPQPKQAQPKQIPALPTLPKQIPAVLPPQLQQFEGSRMDSLRALFLGVAGLLQNDE